MTRAARSLGSVMQQEAVQSVSTDVNFALTTFPKYTIGVNNVLIEHKEEDPKLPSLKEIVAKETAQLLEQQQRLSVRDLAKRFEKGLETASKLSNETRLREITSVDKYVLLKKLWDILGKLKTHVVGRNKDDVDESISMVEALAGQLSQTEGELLLEKEELKKHAFFLKKATDEAKKVVEEERAQARAEIDNAKAAMQRIEQAVVEREKISETGEKQKLKDLEELRKEVQEARRIKMLHQPSKVMDMELELQALRIQLVEKSNYATKLHKELEMSKKGGQIKSQFFDLEGLASLGSYLQIFSQMKNISEISICSVQWYRIHPEDGKKELISGATKLVYAPEPFDVGRFLQADIVACGERVQLRTISPIDPAAGLGSYVETLLRKHETEFNLCGVRGSDCAAAQALFWQAKFGLSFSLGFESARERNAAIMLARRFAFDCNIVLAGPNERSSAAA